MKSERWQKVKGLFDAVVELSPDERQQFLEKSCGTDTELRREVESLLESADEAKSFMESPAVAELADVIEENGKKIEAGKCFAHYEVIKQIGAGGMGEVYLARDKKLDRKVAIKILNEKFAKHESNLERFTKEAKSASALNHPNILVIHEIGESENSHYIVSEYIEGETLREKLKGEPLKLSEILDIAIQIANALVAAHRAKIIHRDIKPENIITRPDGFVKILDFGLAKLIEQKAIGFEDSTVKQNETAKGIILGTINYMSPEQAKGEKVDERTDIFSFGTVIYEMIAGRLPFAGDSTSETFANLINAEPQPLSRFAANVPDEMQRIVTKTLRKNKDARYQTMKGALADLKGLRENLAFDEKLEKSHPPGENATAKLPTVTIGKINQTGETNDNFIQRIKRHKSLAAFGLAILLIAIISFGYYFWKPEKSPSITDGKKSLAVLPFVNVSQDPNAEYLSDGIADSVINRLSQLSNLKVMSRNSAFRFKGNQTDTKNIAAQLNVENLVLGDIKQIGDKFIINVSLINAKEDSTIWGSQYVKTSGDIIAAQNEIARDVAENLRGKLSDSEKKRLGKNYTANPEAYQLYLKGRFHLLKTTRAGFQNAIPLFQQAIEIDPNYALAYVGLADGYRSLAMAGEMPATEVMPKAKAAANKALEIDDGLSDAHGILGFIIFWYDWDWKAAENQFKRAIELDPENSDAHLFYANLLSNLERHTEALAEAEQARNLDPLNLRTNGLEVRFMALAGQTDEAFKRLQKTFELDPNYWLAHQGLVITYLKKEKYAEAVTAAQKSVENYFNTRNAAFLGFALAKAGKTKEARAELEKLLKLSQEIYVPATSIATIYSGLNEREEALKWLERGIGQREPRMTFLKVEPQWDNLRDEPRFQDLMRRVGFDKTADIAKTNSKLYWQMSDAEQLNFISERARHIHTLIGDDSTEFNEEALRAIKDEIDDYVERKDSLSQKKFEEGLRVIYGRASQFVPIVTRAYESRQVPPALGIYQAMIESEYNDCLISSLGSVGLFQFIPKTAAKYGLTQKDYCNVEKQSDAAARYMSDLSSDFVNGKSSATLGLFGFVMGENQVRDYLRQLRGRGITERSFWTVFQHRKELKPPLVNHQGEWYVPRFFAAAIIGETPKVFELSTPPLTTLR